MIPVTSRLNQTEIRYFKMKEDEGKMGQCDGTLQLHCSVQSLAAVTIHLWSPAVALT